jgi:hypothetical protein
MNGNQRIRTDAKRFESAPDPSRLQDIQEQLDFIDQGALAAPPGFRVIERLAQMLRKQVAENPQMFLILSSGLVEAEKTVAFALEQGDGINHPNAIDVDGSVDEAPESCLREPVDIAQEVNGFRNIAVKDEDTHLTISGGASLDGVAPRSFRRGT